MSIVTQREINGQIMMTYRCSAACRHCLVMAAPDQDPSLVTVEDAVEYARDYQKLGRRVMIAGGEALLFYNHVVAMCRAIMDAGIPILFIESNGSWCTSDELVTERLTLLRSLGVMGMFFSIDPYHQEFVPADRVCRGIRIATEIFGEENMVAPSIPLEKAREFEDVHRDEGRLRQYTRGRHVFHYGRAADALAQFADPIPVEELEKVSCSEELDVDTLYEIQVDPFGYVRPDMCPGVNLGNTRHERLLGLACTKRVRQMPLLQKIAEGGPCVLLSRAERSGFTPCSTYASKCHLCFEIRRHLVHEMPDEFGPRHLYEVQSG